MKALGAGKAQALCRPGNDHDFSCVLHDPNPFYVFDIYGYVIQLILNFDAIASPDKWQPDDRIRPVRSGFS
jgi:hypothetical protein